MKERKITYFKLFLLVSLLLLFMSQRLNADIDAKLADSAGANSFRVLDSTGLSLMNVFSNGNVGIGTTNPGTKLDVVTEGDNSIIRSITYITPGTPPIFSIFGGWAARGTEASPTKLLTNDIMAVFSGVGYGDTGFGTVPPPQASMIFFAEQDFTDSAKGTGIGFYTTPIGSIGTSRRMTITADGNVGIGTTNPGETLHVVTDSTEAGIEVSTYSSNANDGTAVIVGKARGTMAAPSALLSGDFLGEFAADGYGATGWYGSNFIAFITTEDWTDTAQGASTSFYTTANGTAAPTLAMKIDHNGNVGIGTTSPSAKLDTWLSSTSTTAGTETGGVFNVSDIGVVTTGTDITVGAAVNVTRTGAVGGTINTTGMTIYVTGDTGGTSQAIGLDVAVSGADTNYAAIFSGGNVGIDTATPSYKLHVNGTIRAEGSDIAEPFDMVDIDELEMGDVVTIDPDNPVHVKKSSKAYDRMVAGIISSKKQAGYIAGGRSDGTSNKPLALAGRVLCKVNTENGIINIGDLLTTSNTPGYAMKATDREKSFGAVLGKALESFDGNKGTIMVLVALQ